MTGFTLRALGRLSEAAQPMQAGLAMRISQEAWGNAARNASVLSELYLTLGELSQARKAAQQSVNLADRSGDFNQRMSKLTTLADVLHQSGELPEAEAEFHAAEVLQREIDPAHPLLYSVWGFRYCDFLLGQGQVEEVRIRATQTLEWIEQYYFFGPLSIALDNLTLARAHLSSTDAGTCATAAPFLHRAVDGLRQAGQLMFLPLGLLARAAWARVTKQFDQARRDLAEAFTIAERGEMRLHLADCYLEFARLSLATGDSDSARKAWETAKAMIKEMGYHRRDGEVAELSAQLGMTKAE